MHLLRLHKYAHAVSSPPQKRNTVLPLPLTFRFITENIKVCQPSPVGEGFFVANFYILGEIHG